MRILRPTILAIAVLVMAAPACGEGDASLLQVHLPRTVTVEADAIRLSMISVVRADDKAVERLASEIPMGRSPWSKEELVIDRPTILGRLASQGIQGSRVRLTGADRVLITRRETAVKAGDIVQAAKAFLEDALPHPKGCEWRLAREPEELVALAGGNVALEPRLVPHAVDGEARVEVAATVEGRKVGATHLLFRLGHPHYGLVAVEDIPAGGAVTPRNTEMQTVIQDRPQAHPGVPPYGQVALRPIQAGEAIEPNLVRPTQPKLLVRRNDSVIMRITGELFQVTDLGLALENGHQGELVRVRNVGSGRVVVARVMADGSVEPVVAGVKP